MKVTLVADHRVVDGLYSAQYLVELKRLLENPAELQG
jgi:pyruvate dehydrogenase E2 component (dihydrolipoamide acetyltransferase)